VIFGAEGGGLDPATMIPIGTVTGMLVAVFVLFIRDSARNDQRADDTYGQMVKSAEAERDRYRTEAEEKNLVISRLTASRIRDTARIYQLESALQSHGIPIPPSNSHDGADG
jgi:hypothetical protein